MKEISIEEIRSMGTKVKENHDWYRYRDYYYLITRRRMDGPLQIITKTRHLVIDEISNSYKFLTIDGMSTILHIGGCTTIVMSPLLSEIIPFRDEFFICPTSDGTQKELRRGSMLFASADDFYRMKNGVFVGVSDGIHTILKMDEKKSMKNGKKSKSKWKLEVDEDGNLMEFVDNKEWRKL